MRFNRHKWVKGAKRTGWTLLIIIALANIFILVSGKFYLYKAIANTVFEGRLGPTIDEQDNFFNRKVEVGTPQPWHTHHRYTRNQLRKKDIERFKEIGTVSYLIIKHDSLYFEQYWEGFGPNTISNSFSVAKSVVSLLVGIAIDEGKIKSLDEPVGNYLKNFSEGEYAKITIRHLLIMSSGLEWDESGSNPLSHNAEAYYTWNLKRLINELEVEREPGVEFNYQSGNHQVVAFVLEEATGMSLSEYFSEKVWKKVGATTEGLWNLDDEDGHEKAFCCIYATPRDFARIGKLMLDSGKWDGQRVVSESYVKESLTPANTIEEDGSENDKYGLSWWIANYNGTPFYYARGILGQYIVCVPKYDIVIVRTGYERGEKLDNDHPEDLYWYIEAAMAMMGEEG